MSAVPDPARALNPAAEPELWLKSFRPRIKRQLNVAVGLGLASGLLLVAQAALFAFVISHGVMLKAPLRELWPQLAALVLIFALRFALVRASERVAFAAGARIRLDLRGELMRHVQRLGPVWLAGQARGDMVNSLVNGIEALEGYYARYLPTLSITALVPLAILVAVMPSDWLSGLVLLLTAPLIPLFMWLIGRGAEELNQRQWSRLAFLSARFLDSLQGLTTLKLFGASRREAQVVARVSDAYRSSVMQVLRVAFLSALVLEFLSTVSIAVVAVLIGFRLMWGELHLLPGLFVLLLAPEYYAPLRNLGTAYHQRMEAIGAAERIALVLATPSPQPRTGAATLVPAAHAIAFEDVHFSYEPGRPALAGCSFTAPAGKITAIVGASGAGKSTVLSLLQGFVRAQQGRITASGVDLGEVDEADWLSQVAWVPPRAHLFVGSVADNIRLGHPAASAAQVAQAAAAAQVDAFIRQLPQGYATIVGEGGAGLSRGQLQRLSLARAFLKDAPVVLLDEATSNLDTQSQRVVLQALAALAQGRTVIMVAHRLRTLDLADHIVVMDHGIVAEAGTRAELLAADGAYARMLRIARSSA